MPLAELLLPEFDEEMTATRRVLERVPDGKAAWKPHPKSMTLGRLATLVAELPGWVVNTITRDELDIMPPGGVHHRGQLTVYLRLNGAPVPAVYGPTADEPNF